MSIWKLLEPLKTRIRMILNRALLEAIDDSKSMQLIKVTVMEGEVKDLVERIQEYGFTSVPRKGSEALVGFIGGNKDQGIAIKVDDSRVRLKDLPDGSVAMYHYSGHKIVMTDDTVEITLVSGKTVNINARNVNVNLESGGQFSVAGSNLTVDA